MEASGKSVCPVERFELFLNQECRNLQIVCEHVNIAMLTEKVEEGQQIWNSVTNPLLRIRARIHGPASDRQERILPSQLSDAHALLLPFQPELRLHDDDLEDGDGCHGDHRVEIGGTFFDWNSDRERDEGSFSQRERAGKCEQHNEFIWSRREPSNISRFKFKIQKQKK
ncbi:hypothetical protein AVEN_73287-1 [Araneus ventricosus]|uniref:Uncharacterized protein n=1 Tax=Araneus ventricosus TaxID=182803 RepID=A0A4Y2KID0_ARAVE|nr:hypothetical protein AVEN_73287-1 [Araneus ventricosus]